MMAWPSGRRRGLLSLLPARLCEPHPRCGSAHPATPRGASRSVRAHHAKRSRRGLLPGGAASGWLTSHRNRARQLDGRFTIRADGSWSVARQDETGGRSQALSNAEQSTVPEPRSARALAARRRPLDWPEDREFRILSIDRLAPGRHLRRLCAPWVCALRDDRHRLTLLGRFDHRDAISITIQDADSAMDDLIEKVQALAAATDQRPADTTVAIALLKRYLPDPVHRIRLHEPDRSRSPAGSHTLAEPTEAAGDSRANPANDLSDATTSQPHRPVPTYKSAVHDGQHGVSRCFAGQSVDVAEHRYGARRERRWRWASAHRRWPRAARFVGEPVAECCPR